MTYYTAIIIISWFSLAVLSVLVAENDRLSAKDKRLYYLTNILIAVSALSEWLGIRLNGSTDTPLILLRIVKCADYILTPTAGMALVTQLQTKSSWTSLMHGTLLFNAVFQLVSFFTDWVLVFDKTNHYAHGPLYPVYSVLYLMVIIFIGGEFIRYGAGFRRQNRVSLFATLFLVVAGILLQEISGGEARTAYISLALGATMMFIHTTEFSQLHTDDAIREQQFQLMISQIQPHFIHNSLAAIQELCETDPKEAGKAISTFSKYLRGNMDSMKNRGAIPFSSELEHTRLYLELEKLRFEDALQITSDITCTDFQVPALSLQPITENAVKYGARGKKQEVGTVHISTREYDDRYEVVVTDNGPGFDPEAVKSDTGRSHIGINNVKNRLRMICGGSMIIESTPGEGTTVTMIIPKVGKKNVDIYHR